MQFLTAAFLVAGLFTAARTQTVPSSPCPDVFQYIGGKYVPWKGMISIKPPASGTILKLKVEMYLKNALPTKFSGRLNPVAGKDDISQLLSEGSKELIKYELLFPSFSSIPQISYIKVNQEIVCQGPKETSGVVTKISLEHIMNFAESRKPVLPAYSEICGQRVTANTLAGNGGAIKPGDWPWVAAIFTSIATVQEFRCSGTLLNQRHVVTVAHCLASERDNIIYSSLRPDQIVVYLGKHNIIRFAEPRSQLREVEKVFIHPNFRSGSNYGPDLAILQLKTPAEYTNYVRPICMWTRSQDLSAIVGNLGVVVGWGTDEKGNTISEEPRLFQIPIVSQETCLSSNPKFVSTTSNHTFCGGFRNGTGPCKGDSGNGLVLPYMDGSEERWYLRGITSVTLLTKQDNHCDLANYIVFTDVAMFKDWLSQFSDNEPTTEN